MRRWLVALFLLIAAPAWATLPASGTITFNMVADEIGVSHTGFSITSSNARTLAGIPSGVISLHDFYGKSWIPPLTGATLGFTTITSGPSAPNSHVFTANSCTPVGGSGSYTYLWTIFNTGLGTWTVSAVPKHQLRHDFSEQRPGHGHLSNRRQMHSHRHHSGHSCRQRHGDLQLCEKLAF